MFRNLAGLYPPSAESTAPPQWRQLNMSPEISKWFPGCEGKLTPG